MRTMAFANQKGGCGKTTTAVNVAAALAVKEKRVLLIDMDPQAHATIGIAADRDPQNKSIHSLLLASSLTKENIQKQIMQIGERLFLLPSEVTLCALDMELAESVDREQRLAHLVEKLAEDYDFIIIDAPPNLGLLTFNVLLAAEELVVPIDMSFLSLNGLGKLLETVKLVEEKCAHPLRVFALANHVDKRTCLSREILHHIEDRFLNKMFHTTIHDRTRIREAMGFGLPVVQYAPSSSSAQEFLSLAQEILENQVPSQKSSAKNELQDSEKSVHFSFYAPEAKEVKLAGDFNAWNVESHPLTNLNEDGFWSSKIKLEPGIYEYKFLVDGEWRHDPNNPFTKENEFGAYNSVFEVQEMQQIC